jgi:hypothetical protein
MGWSINPNQLARIDNNGHVTFEYHSVDTIYTVTYNDGTCNKSKQVLVHACSTPDVCNCTITPSGSANELPAETGDTEYEVVTYSSSNCIKSAPDILYIGGTDFLGSFRNENGKTYAKVKLENTDSEVKTGRYLFMISNCRAEVEFTQMAVTPSQSCSILSVGSSIIPRSGGNLRLFAVGCGGKSCMKVTSEEGPGYSYVYTFYIENPDTPIDYSQGNFPTVLDSNGNNVTGQFDTTMNTHNVQLEAQQSAGVRNGTYTMVYENRSAGITDCQTEFVVYLDYCRYANPHITQTTFSVLGDTAMIMFDNISYMNINVTSSEGWCQIITYGPGRYMVQVGQNTDGKQRDAVITVKINGDVCRTFNITQFE